jgi:hypothetical protein
MRVRALRGFVGQEGSVRRGIVLDVDDKRAAYLLRKGLAEEVQMGARPLSDGPTGEAKRPSSSRAGRQPRKSVSKPAGDALDSSP